MNKPTPEKASAKKRQLIDRRSFLVEGAGALAGLLLFGRPAWGAISNIKIWRQAPDGAASGVHGAPSLTTMDFKIPKLFINETLNFEITFLGATTAVGTLSFKQISNTIYTASVEGSMAGVIGALIPFRKYTMTSTFVVRQIDGRERFVSTSFYRKSITTNGTLEYRHEFNYARRRWTNTRYKDGKRGTTESKAIPADVFYDDLVVLIYNFRAQAYGPVVKGGKFTLNTVPWTRKVTVGGKKKVLTATTVGAVVLSDDQLSDTDREWMKKENADLMIVAKVDKDVYGMKKGEVKFLGDKDIRPLGAWIEDAVGFGDVKAKLKS